MLCQSDKLIVLEGDVLLPGMGLSASDQKLLREHINIIIHSASSINLGRSLRRVAQDITGATEMVAKYASTLHLLDRFVYVSTAFSNVHLHEKAPGTDLAITETFYCLNKEASPIDEWNAVQKYGTSEAYEANDFPWAYGYAKHLTERLLVQLFMEQGTVQKLLIVRPSIMGPAQRLPFPGYCVPLSSPGSMIAAGLMLAPSRHFRIATQMESPDENVNHDMVPVDVVVDRLLAHLAIGTQGCMHAVSGVRSRSAFEKWPHSLRSPRRIPWTLHQKWVKEEWKSPNQHLMSRLYAVLGASFAFSEDKTIELSKQLSQEELLDLNLFTEVDMVDHIFAQAKDIRLIMDHFARKKFTVRLLVWMFYRNYGKQRSIPKAPGRECYSLEDRTSPS